MGKCRGWKEAAFKHMQIKKTNDRGAAAIFLTLNALFQGDDSIGKVNSPYT